MSNERKYGNMPASVVDAVKKAFRSTYGNPDTFGFSQFMTIVLPVLVEHWPAQNQNNPASDEVLRLLREILGAKDGESILDVAREARNKAKDWDLKVGDSAVAVADRHRRDALVLEHVRKALGAEKGRVLAEVSILGRELDNLRAFKDAVQAALGADDGTDMIATINNWRQDRMRVPSIDAEILREVREALGTPIGINIVVDAKRIRTNANTLEEVRKILETPEGERTIKHASRVSETLRKIRDTFGVESNLGLEHYVSVAKERSDILEEVGGILEVPPNTKYASHAKEVMKRVKEADEALYNEVESLHFKCCYVPPHKALDIIEKRKGELKERLAPQKENDKVIDSPKQTATCNDPPFQSPWDAASQLLVKIGSPLRSDNVFREFFERNAARADYISCDPGFPGDFACCVAITKKDGVVTVVDHTTWRPEVSLGMAAKRYIFELTRTDQKKLDRVMQEHVLSAMQEVLTKMQRPIPYIGSEYAQLLRSARKNMGYSYNEFREKLGEIEPHVRTCTVSDLSSWEKQGSIPLFAWISIQKLLGQEIAKLTEKLAQNQTA